MHGENMKLYTRCSKFTDDWKRFMHPCISRSGLRQSHICFSLAQGWRPALKPIPSL